MKLKLKSLALSLAAVAAVTGGLLLAVPAARADALVAALRARGVPVAADIGEITNDRAPRIEVRP